MATFVLGVRAESPALLASRLTAAFAPLLANRILQVVLDGGDTQRVGGMELSVSVTEDDAGVAQGAPYVATALEAQTVGELAALAQATIAAAPLRFWSPLYSVYLLADGRRTKPYVGVLFSCTDAANGLINWGAGGGGGGALAGDVTGPAGANQVVGIRTVPVAAAAAAPAAGDTLIYDDVAGEWIAAPATRYFASGALAQAAAPFPNGSFVVIYPGAPASEAGTYQVAANQGAAFPADYTKLSDHTETASEVGIVDAGGYFSSTNVEGALQELGAGTAGVISGGPIPLALTALDQVSAAAQGAVLWHLELVNGTQRYSSLLNAVHDGAAAYGVESTITVDPTLGVLPFTIDVDISAGNLRLVVTPTAPGWSYRVRRQALPA